MRVETKHFGIIESEEDQFVHFEKGLPGFPNSKKFLLISEENSPFSWLQDVQQKNICFIIMNTIQSGINYTPDINIEDLNAIKFKQDEEIGVFVIIKTGEKQEDITVNLVAPILINFKNNLGVQAIVEDNNFSVRTLLTDLLLHTKLEEEGDVDASTC